MPDKLMYIPNDDSQNYGSCSESAAQKIPLFHVNSYSPLSPEMPDWGEYLNVDI